MKTIRLYHPHTHEGVTYAPPPEGIALTVNDADAALLYAWGLTTPMPVLSDASTGDSDALPPRHDRRKRMAIPADAIDAIPTDTAVASDALEPSA